MTFEERCIDLLGQKPLNGTWFIYETRSFGELSCIINHLSTNHGDLELTTDFKDNDENGILYDRGGFKYLSIYPAGGAYIITTTSMSMIHDKKLDKKEFYSIINLDSLFINKNIPKLVMQ